ncbi:PVC-type heme-binding CxxCH protein [Zavarzinella formosa]|uniref:PVC-type heme-binding CxxCH protein n=1 Tax=Zavarzinella formosa TaxID=360055 RepID=UPI0002F50925|nr:PVC-type heme-binding CxxCH protein [Zavarzinella formosa]
MRATLPAVIVAVLFGASGAFAQKEFGFDNRKGSGQPYLKPEETVARMKVAEGFEVKLFAGEPQLVNPIAMTVDEKGRVWVVECFEYPKRTAKGKMPRDRVRILEDTDGDGVCDKSTIFIEGKDFPVPFDLASGIEVGNGGVYLGAPPYLFFIENKNDKPGKIEVLLKGFGSQDTHETLNTFQWGPDGRLYGLHGVFTYSEVKPGQADGPATRLNAAVWRYDTKTKQFEVFSDGTSNPWGMDYRNSDGQYILACCVIPHLFHMVPGGIYKRQGGQAANPYAYGEIKEICDHTFHKESGWAHAGLISLDTPVMPEKYRNSVIFGSIHGCSLKQNILKPNGSSYTASRGDDFLVSGDKNFRPINLRWGPNGEIYCIDWHDQNPCHQTNPDDWDYERGRVYRIQTKDLKTKKAKDIGILNDGELTEALKDPNPYVARTALRLIGERHPEILALGGPKGKGPPGSDIPAVQLLRYAATSRTEPKFAADFYEKHYTKQTMTSVTMPFEVRAISENLSNTTPATIVQILTVLAKKEGPAMVRRELASSAGRLADRVDVIPILRELLKAKDDVKDPMIPQLLWVAYEKTIAKSLGKAGITDELKWLAENAAGNALITDTIVPRTMKRLVATGKPEDIALCLEFIGGVTDEAVTLKALDALASAIGNRTVLAPGNWKGVQETLAKNTKPEVVRLTNSLAVKFSDPAAIRKALAVAIDAGKPLAERQEAIRDLGVTRDHSILKPMFGLIQGNEDNALRTEAIRAVAGVDAPEVSRDLLASWKNFTPPLRNEVVNALAGRKDWANDLLAAVAKKQVDRAELTDNTIIRIQALKDSKLNTQIEQVWGRMRATPAELNVVIDKMRAQLAAAPGSFARGKIVFDNQCAKCHKFDGRGSEVGPNIEGAGRDIEYLLVNVLDPNRVIGAPYFMRTINLSNGRVETGLLYAEDDQSITLKGENGVLKQIQKRDIDQLKVQEKSLMPEGLGYNMTVQDFRDLVRYVMANPFLIPEGAALPVGVNGRAVLKAGESKSAPLTAEVTAPAAKTYRLLVGAKGTWTLTVNGKTVAVDQKGSGTAAIPDQLSVNVPLAAGKNEIVFTSTTTGKDDAAYLRFFDPNRELRYVETAAPPSSVLPK